MEMFRTVGQHQMRRPQPDFHLENCGGTKQMDASTQSSDQEVKGKQKKRVKSNKAEVFTCKVPNCQKSYG